MTKIEFDLISELIYEKFGIHLTVKKKALVQGRLNKLLIQGGYRNFSEYYKKLRSNDSGKLLSDLIDRISTNYSYFYRDSAHFDFLSQKIVPDILEHNITNTTKNMRIWCAGCAAGEEPYTVAMVLNELIEKSIDMKFRFRVLATDVSIDILNKGLNGVYSPDSLKLLPSAYRRKYFKKLSESKYKINNNIKEHILFKKLNFKEENYPFKNKFDVIFCRNVLIYFDEKTRKTIINKFSSHIKSGGYLIIGNSETMPYDINVFEYINKSVYKRL